MNSLSVIVILWWLVNILQDATARLLNAIVSSKRGRNYIGNNTIVPLLFWGDDLLGIHMTKPRTKICQTTADNLMAAIFKISLIPKQRSEMLHRDVTQWTIDHLIDVEDSTVLTDYHLEACTSLLLVLLSQLPNIRQGSSECTTLLERLLTCRDAASRQNVCMCMQTLMQNPKIRAHSKSMGMEDAIIKKLTVSVFFFYKILMFAIIAWCVSIHITLITLDLVPLGTESSVLQSGALILTWNL